MAKPERIHPTDIREGDMVANLPSHTFLKAEDVRHYIAWTSCWHATEGTAGGFRVQYNHDEWGMYRLAK